MAKKQTPAVQPVEITYSFVVTVQAAKPHHAQVLRDEVAGSAEDARESGLFRGEVMTGQVEVGDIEDKLSKYRALHDLISSLYEDGELDSLKKANPQAYEKLTEKVVELAGLDAEPTPKAGTRVGAALG
jgi:hypothetical protein